MISDDKYSFIMRKVKLLHKFSKCKDCISLGFITNVRENDFVGGIILGAFSFGILVDEVVFSCMACYQGLSSGGFVVWPIKRVIDFNTWTLLSIENNFNNNKSKTTLKVLSQNHNIKFVGDKVNLIHQCSLNPNYVAWGIVSSGFEGDIVQFKPLDVSEFGILVYNFFCNCGDYGIFEGPFVKWTANHFLELNVVPLDAILKMNTK